METVTQEAFCVSLAYPDVLFSHRLFGTCFQFKFSLDLYPSDLVLIALSNKYFSLPDIYVDP